MTSTPSSTSYSTAGGRRRSARLKSSTSSSSAFPFLKEPCSSLFPTRAELAHLLVAVAIAVFVAFACNMVARIISTKIKPFCDSAGDAVTMLDDSCEPCPINGLCDKGKFECSEGHKKHGRICIEDGVISQRASKILESVEHELCKEQAQVLCGRTGKIWFYETDVDKLIEGLMSRNPTGLKGDVLKLVRDKVIEGTENLLESRLTPNSGKEFKCPKSLAELKRPLNCLAREWLHKHVYPVMTFLTLSVGLLHFLWTIRKQKILLKRAEQLYQQVCEILEDSAINCSKGTNQESKPWIVASWLRDHLLSPKERKEASLWKKVEELLLEDSRIDQYPKLIKGESKVVWEWQVDGDLSAKMKKMQGLGKRYQSMPLASILEFQRPNNGGATFQPASQDSSSSMLPS